MATNSSAASQVVQDLEQANAALYCSVASGALIIYEHIGTLEFERQYIWAQKFTVVTLLFIINRYLLLLYGVTAIMAVLNWYTVLSCETIVLLLEISETALSAAVAALVALRTFAISRGTWALGALTLATGFVPVAINITGHVKSSYAHLLFLGGFPECYNTPYVSAVLSERMVIAARTGAVISDALVLATTWYQTFKLRRVAKSVRVQTPLVSLLLKDGTLYFFPLLVLNMLDIILSLQLPELSSPWKVAQAEDVTGYFIIPLSSMLMSRFILNLRQLSASSTDSPSNAANATDFQITSTHFPSLQFAERIVGPIGATLDFGAHSILTASPDDADDVEVQVTESEENAEIIEVSEIDAMPVE